VADGVGAAGGGRAPARAHFSPSRASRPAACRSTARGSVPLASASGRPGVPADRAAVVREELARGTNLVARRFLGRASRRCPRSGLPDAVRLALSARVNCGGAAVSRPRREQSGGPPDPS
jgi:hypothetical protein